MKSEVCVIDWPFFRKLPRCLLPPKDEIEQQRRVQDYLLSLVGMGGLIFTTGNEVGARLYFHMRL